MYSPRPTECDRTVERRSVIVPAAGHASTLGTQLDLAAELRLAFGAELGVLDGVKDAGGAPDLAPVRAPRGLATCGEDPFVWANGLLPRSYNSLPVGEYAEWNRGCRRCPLE